MNDPGPGLQQERGPDHCLPAMLGDERGYLPSEWLGRLLTLSFRKMGHTAEIDLIAPKEVGEAHSKVLHC